MLAKRLFSVALAATALSLGASMAAAHFVWIETEANGAGLLVRSGFGESAGWDPDLIDRMGAAQFWQQSAAGLAPLEMKLDKQQHEFRTVISGPRPAAIVASCDFGVVQFGGNPPAWLRYTAKALDGPAASWAVQRAEPSLRIEILAAAAGNGVRLTAVHLGKPLAGAKIKCESPKQVRSELLTDEHGVAQWACPDPGLYACYVGKTSPATGKVADASYEALKDYATLTFSMGKAD